MLNLGIELKEMQKCLHRLTDEDDGLRSRIEQLLKDLKEFREERIRRYLTILTLGGEGCAHIVCNKIDIGPDPSAP